MCRAHPQGPRAGFSVFRRHLEAEGKIAQRPSKQLHGGLFSVILRGSLALREACVILADEFIAVTTK